MNGFKEKGISVAAGVFGSFFASVLLLLAAAFLMLQLQPGADKTELVVLVIYGLACLAGGWIAGKKGQSRKFLLGLMTGICYFLLLFLLSMFMREQVQPEKTNGLLAFLLCSLSGTFGGMLA